MLGEVNTDVANTTPDIANGGAFRERIPRDTYGDNCSDEVVNFIESLPGIRESISMTLPHPIIPLSKWNASLFCSEDDYTGFQCVQLGNKGETSYHGIVIEKRFHAKVL